MVQQATDDLLWDSSLDRDRREGMAQRVKGAGNVVMIPRDDMTRPAVCREHPAVIETAHGIENAMMLFDERQPKFPAELALSDKHGLTYAPP